MRKLLIVDDDEALRRLMRLELSDNYQLLIRASRARSSSGTRTQAPRDLAGSPDAEVLRV